MAVASPSERYIDGHLKNLGEVDPESPQLRQAVSAERPANAGKEPSKRTE
jgi:hypothetical protein